MSGNCGRCTGPLQVIRGMRLPCACSVEGDRLELAEWPSTTLTLDDLDAHTEPIKVARFRKRVWGDSSGYRWFVWEDA